MKRLLTLGLALALLALALAGCFPASPDEQAAPAPDAANVPAGDAASAKPKLPSKLELVDGVPQLTVYKVAERTRDTIDIESYVEGVLAGEMRNDWPMEALKAQAILARTFVVKFVEEKTSQYENADISTDIKEAQAYDEQAINERIKKAVDETRGLVMVADGKFPYAWFHAHAGGITELAKAALQWKDAEPPYTQSVESPDSDKAPTAVKDWTATFTKSEVEKAAADAGVKVGKIESIEIGEQAQSGRAITFTINGKAVSGPGLRIALDSKKLKSTLVSSVKIDGNSITFTGKGYGHGVGMSQWGAYGMAEEGKSGEDIVKHYFKDVSVMKLWD